MPSQKDIIKDVNMAKLFRFLEKKPIKSWEETQKHGVVSIGRITKRCYSLVRQIEEFVKRGLLQILKDDGEEADKIGLEVVKDAEKGEGRKKEEHEKPTMGDLNTIAGGFLGGGVSNVDRKRYARSVMQLATEVAHTPTLNFTREDLEDVFPYDNDPIVILVVMKSRRIHKVLVDQGSSTDVLF